MSEPKDRRLTREEFWEPLRDALHLQSGEILVKEQFDLIPENKLIGLCIRYISPEMLLFALIYQNQFYHESTTERPEEELENCKKEFINFAKQFLDKDSSEEFFKQWFNLAKVLIKARVLKEKLLRLTKDTYGVDLRTEKEINCPF